MQTSRCKTCDQDKPATEFYKNEYARPRPRCIECTRSYRKQYYRNNSADLLRYSKEFYENNIESVAAYKHQYSQKNRDKIYEKRIRHRYKMSMTDYEDMLRNQGGGCAICGTSASGASKRLPIDHDHSTGKVRGILCGGCNSGIGMLKDDPAVVEAAAQYLRRTKGKS